MRRQDVQRLDFLQLLHLLQRVELFLHALYRHVLPALQRQRREHDRKSTAPFLKLQLVLVHLFINKKYNATEHIDIFIARRHHALRLTCNSSAYLYQHRLLIQHLLTNAAPCLFVLLILLAYQYYWLISSIGEIAQYTIDHQGGSGSFVLLPLLFWLIGDEAFNELLDFVDSKAFTAENLLLHLLRLLEFGGKGDLKPKAMGVLKLQS